MVNTLVHYIGYDKISDSTSTSDNIIFKINQVILTAIFIATNERLFNPHRSLNSFPLTEYANYGPLCILRFLFSLRYTLASH